MDPDAYTAQIHRLPGRTAGIAKLLGYGRIDSTGKWLFSKAEEDKVRAESVRRETERRSKDRNRKRRPSSRHILPNDFLLDVMRGDPLNEVERILFQVSLDLHTLGVETHRAAQLMKAKRIEWEKYLKRKAMGGGS